MGPTDIVTSTLATLVSVRATMKAVNITLQHRPEIHNAGPPLRIRANTCRPWKNGRITRSEPTVKKLRQKVISKLRACSSWRVITPAIDHIMVTATIRKTAFVCVSFISARQARDATVSQLASRNARLRSCSFRWRLRRRMRLRA